MKRPLFLLALVVTIAWWGWFGFRALALATGRLGSVTVTWATGPESTTFARWTPAASEYTFKQDVLQLAPQTKAQFIVIIPKPFRYFRVSLQGAGELTLDDEHRNPARRSVLTATAKRYDRQTLIPVFGGYRLTIRNIGSSSATVKKIQISFQP